ncbi:MAG: 6-hydroxymethylpterin diphosphokinase MptE-like protein [Spirochaetota bacterium]|nr:6-hydroxymethylpterin diphosphokinase MptE-like protein [Spirochaetota bacterium]
MQDEGPRLIDRPGGASIVYKNRDLYGSGPAEASAARRARRFTLQHNTLYVLASPLLWYGAVDILHRLPDSSHVLALEEDAQLASFSRGHMPPVCASNSHLTFIHPVLSESVYSAIKRIGIQNFRRVQLITLNAGYRLYSEVYSRIQKLLEEEIQQFWHNKYTLMHMLPLWIKNLICNLSRIPTLSAQTHVSSSLPASELPVLVAGAGPSLDETLPFLLDHRPEFFLLAVDTAYAPLMKAGLRPDAVVAQEAQFFNLYDFIPEPELDCALIADITSFPGVIRLAAGRIYMVSTFFADIGILDRLDEYGLMPVGIPPMGSVGSTAVELALRITEGPVLFTGIDFSFFPGKTHSKESPQQLRLLQNSGRFRSLIDLSALVSPGVRFTADVSRPGRLLTSSTLDRYAQNFNRYFGGNSRLYRIQSSGVPLDVQTVETAAAASILSGWRGTAPASSPANDAPPFETDRIRAFLENEVQILDEIYCAGRRYLHGQTDEASESRLLSSINRCEYLFLAFPDTGSRLEELGPNIVKRILVSAGHYLHLIKTSLSG